MHRSKGPSRGTDTQASLPMHTLPIVLAASVVLLTTALLMMAVKVLMVRGGRFPSGHAHDIPALRRRGVGCARHPE